MSPLLFYREQAEQQRLAAASATLENVRDRCQRAFEAWSALAARSERAENGRLEALSSKLLNEGSENPDRGLATT